MQFACRHGINVTMSADSYDAIGTERKEVQEKLQNPHKNK